MKKQKLLTDWYGYDKKIAIPESEYSLGELGLASYSSYYYNEKYPLSHSVAAAIKKVDKDLRLKAKNKYLFACDGRTDDEFIHLINETDYLSESSQHENWRAEEVIDRNPESVKKGYLGYLIREFFWTEPRRSDRLFRIIELNEFLHRSKSSQTLEDFLLTDTEYKTKCESLIIEAHSPLSEALWTLQGASFLEFGAKVTIKTRSLLLPLTRDEFVNLLDYKKNPFYSTQRNDTHTYEFAQLFIKGATTGTKLTEVAKMSGPQLHDLITRKFIFNYQDYWQSTSSEVSIATHLPILLDEIRSLSLHSDSFTRNFAHIVSTGALDKLSITELASVLVGYDSPASWAEPSKGKTTLERITELIASGKANPVSVCKIIAYIIQNNLDAIVIQDDLDWSSINEMPAEWAYATLPISSKKSVSYRSKLVSLVK